MLGKHQENRDAEKAPRQDKMARGMFQNPQELQIEYFREFPIPYVYRRNTNKIKKHCNFCCI